MYALTFTMLLPLHVKCNPYIINLSADIYNVTPYIINVRDDIKDAASSEADYKSASYIFNVRGWGYIYNVSISPYIINVRVIFSTCKM
jgi:hypothetical protein